MRHLKFCSPVHLNEIAAAERARKNSLANVVRSEKLLTLTLTKKWQHLLKEQMNEAKQLHFPFRFHI